jgi:hypothetical protein
MLLYCLKCRKKTNAINIQNVLTKNNKPMIKGNCSICNSKVSQFSKIINGKGVVNTMLKYIPEIHMSAPDGEYVEGGEFNNTKKYSYCGPGTKYENRFKQGYKGINDLDKACMKHDQAYNIFKDVENRNIADNELAKISNILANDLNQSEYVRTDAKKVAALMSTKSWLGMGNS